MSLQVQFFFRGRPTIFEQFCTKLGAPGRYCMWGSTWKGCHPWQLCLLGIPAKVSSVTGSKYYHFHAPTTIQFVWVFPPHLTIGGVHRIWPKIAPPSLLTDLPWIPMQQEILLQYKTRTAIFRHKYMCPCYLLDMFKNIILDEEKILYDFCSHCLFVIILAKSQNNFAQQEVAKNWT